MKKSKIKSIIIFSISFILTWLSAIFYFQKNEFDIEFSEKGTTTATIFNLDSREVVEELYEGRKVNVYNVNYIEYSYFVNGVNYKYFSDYFNKIYSIGDAIKIEYVKSNPESSRVKELKNHTHNFFIRNFITLSMLSLLFFYVNLYVIDFLKNIGKILIIYIKKK